MKKTICLVTNLSFAAEPTVKNRLEPYITECLEQGYEVTLVSSDISSSMSYFTGPFQHICFCAEKNRPVSFLKRAFFEWIESRRLLSRLNQSNFDLYIVTIPSMFLLFNIGRLKKKRIALDVRDLTWEYLRDSVSVEKLAKSLFRFCAHKAFAKIDSVIVTNDSELAYFKKVNLDIFTYPNGITRKQFQDLSTLDAPPGSAFVVSYVGKIGIAQNLGVLVRVAQQLPGVQFNIVGYGPQCDFLKNEVIKMRLTNIAFAGNVDWEGVIACYEKSNVLYAQLSENYLSAMPSKLYQYLSTGRYIIYGGEGEAVKTLSSFNGNIVISPDNESALIQAIESLRAANVLNFDPRSNFKEISEHYVRENNVRNILDKLLSS